jgi:hypothetical protein
MILFFNPRATKPKNRRYPLSILALAAMVEGREDHEIVDGNFEDDPQSSIARIMSERPARLLAVSVMPGPQMVAAVPICRWFKATRPDRAAAHLQEPGGGCGDAGCHRAG